MIDDHKPVTATLKLSVPSQVVAERKVWLFRDADRERLQDSLADRCSGHIADKVHVRCGPVDHGHHSAFGQVMYPTYLPSVPQVLPPVVE